MKRWAGVLFFLTGLGALVGVRPVTAKDGPSSPDWILPVNTARALAKRERRPLLIVSLNGNLDGRC